MTECQYFVAVKIWDRQSCVTNQCRDIFMLTNQSWANKWKFHKNNQTALIVLLATWMVRKVAQAGVNFWVFRCHLSPPGPRHPVCRPALCSGCSGESRSQQRTDDWDSCWVGREQTWKQNERGFENFLGNLERTVFGCVSFVFSC